MKGSDLILNPYPVTQLPMNSPMGLWLGEGTVGVRRKERR